MSPVDNGKNIVKHWLSSGEVVSPNQRFWHRSNCLRGFYEYKGLLSKSILVKREREGCGKRLCSITQVYPQRHLATVDNICHRVQMCRIYLPHNILKFSFKITLKFNSLVLLKKWKPVFLDIYFLKFISWLQKLSSCYIALSDLLTTIFVSPWKNQIYLFIINLFTSLIQIKLFFKYSSH